MSDKLRKVFRTAMHPTTDAGTRANAIRAFNAMMQKAQIEVDDIHFGRGEQDEENRLMKQQLADSRHRQRIAEAETKRVRTQLENSEAAAATDRAARAAEIGKLKRAYARLTKRNDALKEEINQHREAKAEAASATAQEPVRDYAPFDEFEELARTTFGHRLWQSAFAHEAGIPTKQLRAWREVGVVPSSFVALLGTLEENQRQPASRKRWTSLEIVRLKTLLAAGMSNLEVARKLSVEFARRIFEGSILGRCRALFRDEGWSPSFASGT